MKLGHLCDLLELGVTVFVIWCKIELNNKMNLSVFIQVSWKVLVLPIILYIMIYFYVVKNHVETQQERE